MSTGVGRGPVTWQVTRAVQIRRARVVGEHDLVHGDGATQPQRGGGAGDPAGLGRAVVGRVDVDAEREPVGQRVRDRADRGEGLGQHAGGAAVPEPERLGVARDRHPADDPLGRQLQHLQPHLGVEGAGGRGEPLGHAHRVSVQGAGLRVRSGELSATGYRVGSCRRETRPKLLLIDGHSVAYRAFFALPVENFSHPDRPAHQRRLRLHLDADQRAARRAADPPRGRVRRVPADLPVRDLHGVQGQPVQDPRRVPGPARPGQGGARTPSTSCTWRRRGSRPTTSSAPWPPRPRQQGFDVLICTGDRDAFQLVTDHVTVLYPRKGVSDLARMTPAAVEEQVLRHPGALSRAGRAGRGDQRQPARRARGRAEDGGQVAGDLRRPGEPGRCTPASSRARRPRRSRSGSRTCCATARSTRWCATSSSPLTIDDLLRRPWDREATHQLFDGLEFRVLRDRLLEALPNEETAPEGGFELSRARSWSRASWPAGWPSTRPASAPAST